VGCGFCLFFVLCGVWVVVFVCSLFFVGCGLWFLLLLFVVCDFCLLFVVCGLWFVVCGLC